MPLLHDLCKDQSIPLLYSSFSKDKSEDDIFYLLSRKKSCITSAAGLHKVRMNHCILAHMMWGEGGGGGSWGREGGGRGEEATRVGMPYM